MLRLRCFAKGGTDSSRARFGRGCRFALAGLLVLWIGTAFVHTQKPLPEGISAEGPYRDVGDMEFIADLTAGPQDGGAVEQRIFDRVFSMISEAEEFVVLDMFLFNGSTGGEAAYRNLSSELTDSLVSWMGVGGDRKAIFITDEINSFYGAASSPEIHRLEEAGVDVVITRLSRLRDSNPVFSGLWRVAFQWFGTTGPGWLPNFLTTSGENVSARAYLKLLNVKANHRKVVVTDHGCLVTSANPHDGSARHSNIAFAGSGPICGDILESERSVAAFSGGPVEPWPTFVFRPASREGAEEGSAPVGGTVRLVTEGKILEAVLSSLETAGPGHNVNLAMFYLSHRAVVEALLEASARGATVRLVLDPNKDAFGREKKGIPNRQVAHELVTRSAGRIEVRWYDTQGEQFHTKMVRVSGPDSTVVIGGSANLTRRNIGDFNLEANLTFAVPVAAPLARATGDYFERVFTNRDGLFTLPYKAFEDTGPLKRIRYRLQEFTGLCTY